MTKEVKLSRANIEDASTGEIRVFALQSAGLEFPKDAGRSYMITEIFRALEWDEYAPDEGATHVTIRMPSSKDDNQNYRGGLNGRMFTIKRDEDVTITVEQLACMIDAQSRKFRIAPIGKDDTIEEGSPASRRLPYGALNIHVTQWINKGGKAEAEVAPEVTE